MEDKNIHLETLKNIVGGFIKDDGVKVYLFGSRARGDYSPASDVDIGIMHGPGFDKKKLALMREYIEESNIPYKVEIVDLSETSEEFRNIALKEAIIWKG